jgi:hypothetical protein
MKFPCRALLVFFLATCAASAAKESDDSPIGDFAPLDDDLVLYIPKFAVKFGFRGLSGASTSFGGKGFLSSLHSISDPTGVINRIYHDGYVLVDARTVTDPAGNTVLITPDGQTNSWQYVSAAQVGTDQYAGLMAFHAYGATVTDTTQRTQNIPTAFGMEISLEREMGSFWHDRVKWGVIAGMSINQIAAEGKSTVDASVLTTTDYYDLNGRAAPTTLPYIGPQVSGSIDTTVLLGSEPVKRTFATTTTTTAFTTGSHLRGAYMTFRAGPTLYIPIVRRFSATVSAGAVLVFTGSTLDVTQSFKPDTGDEITQTISDSASRLLPGFYVDADLQFAMTDTAGLYLGGVYQNSGDYVQTVSSADGTSTYSTRVDLSKLQGIRAGVSFKF